MPAEKTAPQVLAQPSSEGILTKPQKSPLEFYKKVREMRKDPTVALARSLSVAPALVAKWSVEAKQGAPPGARELVEKCVMPLRLHLLRSAMFGCSDYGWQPYEKVFDFNEAGQTELKKLKPLLQDFTDILVDVKTGAYAGLKQEQLGETEEQEIPVAETLCLAFDVEGTNWYGAATMTTVEKAYDKWEQTEKGADRYDRKLAGAHWVIKYPLGTSDQGGSEVDNFEIAKNILNTLEASGGVVVPRTLAEHVDSLNENTPDAWTIELLSDKGGQAAFMERQKYFDALKVRAYLLPERAVLEGQFGTKAEAQVHADLGITMMEVRHALIVQQVNWHLVDQLLVANYGPQAAGTVYVVPSPIADLDREYLKQLYSQMIQDPNAMMAELAAVDLEQMRDRLGVPSLPTAPSELDALGVSALTEPSQAVDAYGQPTGDQTANPTSSLPSLPEVPGGAPGSPEPVLASLAETSDFRLSGMLARGYAMSPHDVARLSREQRALLVAGLELGWVTMNSTPVLIDDGTGEVKAPAAVKRALAREDRETKQQETKRKQSGWSRSANAAYDQLEERQAAGEDVRQAMANLVEEHGDLPGPGGVGTLRDYVRASQAARENATPEADAAADRVFASATIEDARAAAAGQPGVKDLSVSRPPRVPTTSPVSKSSPKPLKQAWDQIRAGNPYPIMRTTKGFFAPLLRAGKMAQAAIDAFGGWYERTFDSQELATSFDQSRDDSLELAKYSCAMIMLPDELAAEVLDLADEIADDDLYVETDEDGAEHKGREDEPHVTVKYGLKDTTPGSLRRIVEDYGPVRVTLGDVTIFKCDEYDVVKLDVKSRGLHALHDAICEKLPYHDTGYDEYVPHVTLAYVKPGRGKRYVGPSGLAGRAFITEDVVFSTPDERRSTLALAFDGGDE